MNLTRKDRWLPDDWKFILLVFYLPLAIGLVLFILFF